MKHWRSHVSRQRLRDWQQIELGTLVVHHASCDVLHATCQPQRVSGVQKVARVRGHCGKQRDTAVASYQRVQNLYKHARYQQAAYKDSMHLRTAYSMPPPVNKAWFKLTWASFVSRGGGWLAERSSELLAVAVATCMSDEVGVPDAWLAPAAARWEGVEEELAMCVSMRDTERRSFEMWRLPSECGCAVAGGANSLAMRRPPSGCEPADAVTCWCAALYQADV